VWLVVGLGNPGKNYEHHRHNIGFKALDDLADREGFPLFSKKFSGEWSRGSIGDQEVTLLKPLTFMNLSGDSVQPAATFLKVPPARIIALHDELEIPFGDVRVKIGGGHSGHNGLRSMMGSLGGAEFVRIRLGIGRPPPTFTATVADFVLGNFTSLEVPELAALIAKAHTAVRSCVLDGPVATLPPATGRRGGPKFRA
jgi:peptidyl-tRNA hydrolase, PTH1 family